MIALLRGDRQGPIASALWPSPWPYRAWGQVQTLQTKGTARFAGRGGSSVGGAALQIGVKGSSRPRGEWL